MQTPSPPATATRTAARGYERTAQPPDDASNDVALKRAVIYLRVSTDEQASRGKDAEGYSIPAQREACYRKAKELSADVVDQYIDRGEIEGGLGGDWQPVDNVVLLWISCGYPPSRLGSGSSGWNAAAGCCRTPR